MILNLALRGVVLLDTSKLDEYEGRKSVRDDRVPKEAVVLGD